MKADSLLAGARTTAVLLALLAVPLHSLAAPEGVGTAALNLQLPPPAASAALRPVMPVRNRPALRLEPRKTFIDRGVEGSREALIACQNGAYPGATVAAAAVQVSGGDSQPGHCYRF